MKTAFKNIGWFFKQEWKRYIFAGINLLILAFISVIPAWLLGIAIDEIVSGSLTVKRLVVLISSFFGVTIFRYIVNYVYHYYINYLGHKLSFSLREKYISHLFDLDASVYEKYTKGDLISRATNDLQNLTALATNLLQTIVFNSSVVISAIVMMVIINPLLTLASVIIMPIAIFWLNKKRLKKREYYKIHHEIYADMTEIVLESIEGVKAIRAYGQEENDFNKTKGAIEKDANSWWRILKFESIYGPLFEFVYVFCYFVGIAYGSYMVITTTISPGDLITFLMYIGTLYGPLIALSNVLNLMNNIIISDNRYHEIMRLSPEVHDKADAHNVMDFEKIEFNNVSFKYPFEDIKVINDITFTISKGETIGIVGPTGAGKSTLIRQLLREFNITEGEILIDGVDISEYKIEDVHDLIGYVPQDHVLFRRTVDNNILIGNPNATVSQIDNAITLADFKKDLAELPYGSETMVAELGGSLSGGQRQRLSIARALVKDPKILILDDSLSAVDALTEANIVKRLKEDTSGRTNIIVAHRFSAIASADKIIVLQNGRITDIGNHDQLSTYDNWYHKQYLKQIKGEQYEES